jgi:hypothetical protein
VIGWEPGRRALRAKHRRTCWPLKAPGKSCPLGGLPAFLCDVQHKIAAARWWILMSWKRDVIWRKEVVERGVGAKFSTDASRSRAEHVLLSYSK